MAGFAFFIAAVAVLGGAATAAVTDDAADAGASDDAQTLLVLAGAAGAPRSPSSSAPS
jgi:hypothetical protein